MPRFLLLLAGYAAILSRFSGQDDIVIGIPVAGGIATRSRTSSASLSIR